MDGRDVAVVIGVDFLRSKFQQAPEARLTNRTRLRLCPEGNKSWQNDLSRELESSIFRERDKNHLV
jgi:hypothetical protein